MQLLATAGCTSRLLQNRKQPNSPSVFCCEQTELRDFCECRHEKSHSPSALHPSLVALLPLTSPWKVLDSLRLPQACLLYKAISGCICSGMLFPWVHWLSSCSSWAIDSVSPVLTPHVCPPKYSCSCNCFLLLEKTGRLALGSPKRFSQSKGTFFLAPRAVTSAPEDALQDDSSLHY